MKLLIVILFLSTSVHAAPVTGLIGGKPWTAVKAFITPGEYPMLRLTSNPNADCNPLSSFSDNGFNMYVPKASIDGDYILCDKKDCVPAMIYEHPAKNFLVDKGSLKLQTNGNLIHGILDAAYSYTTGYQISGEFDAELCNP